ncbi:MAG: phage tail protein [Saprospiraceae bacterium]|nr:phage tail protein [Saprospiraceae bacterium]
MDGYIAQIIWFAGNFAPRNWAYCQGQLMDISQNDALFALIGTTYGGDGQTTFALPDFRGRVPIGTGGGPGLSNYQLGQMSGSEQTTLSVANLPSHTHPTSMKVGVSTANGTTDEPNGNVLAGSTTDNYAPANSGNGQLAGVSATEAPSGGNGPAPILQPTLAMNFVICLYGIFPSRS